ncbi:unnamed protein product, partial [Coregonus sp. 'balchen']
MRSNHMEDRGGECLSDMLKNHHMKVCSLDFGLTAGCLSIGVWILQEHVYAGHHCVRQLLCRMSCNVLRQLRATSTGLDFLQAKVDIFLSGLSGVAQVVYLLLYSSTVVVTLHDMMLGFYNIDQFQWYIKAWTLSNPMHGLKTIAREEGFLELYKEASALDLRESPCFATYFTIYHVICEQLSPPGKTQPGCFYHWSLFIHHFVLDVDGGSACWWTLRDVRLVHRDTHRRDQIPFAGGRYRQEEIQGFLPLQSIGTEGPGVLFKGLGLNCIRAFPVI